MTRPGRQAGGPKVPERAKEKRSARKEGATERSAETRSVEGERDRASSSARAPLAPVRDEGPVLEGRLTIDLGAIAENWRALDARSSAEVETAAVIKADAYGLGAERVAPILAAAGARSFFVAQPSEGVALRAILGEGPTIYILGGYAPGHRTGFADAHLRPVLNSPRQLQDWLAGPAGPAALQLDTGMNRLGCEPSELAALGPLPACITLVMSHLACADDWGHAMNAEQRTAFVAMVNGLTSEGAEPVLSLGATGGILLGGAYHFGMVRPGIGLFGGAPFRDAQPVVRLEAPIIQIRDIAPGEAVGYGAAYRARRPMRIATVSTGYADGIIRAAGNRAAATLAGRSLSYAGRVSMDLITLDVTHCPEAEAGAMVELIGPGLPLDTLAEAAGTIGYEMLTSLGRRYARHYIAPGS